MLSLIVSAPLADAAAQSQYIPYRGELEEGGYPVHRTMDFRFYVYDTADETATPTVVDGTGALWWEEHDDIDVQLGVFDLFLGSVTPMSGLSGHSALFIGVAVRDGASIDPEEFTVLNGRQRIGSVQFARGGAPGTDFVAGGRVMAVDGFGYVPVGTILPWHGTAVGQVQPPEGWARCDGQAVSDAASPFDGQTLPDLNGGRRFLRGSSTSGAFESHAFQAHAHNASSSASLGGITNCWSVGGAGPVTFTSGACSAATSVSVSVSTSVGTPSTGNTASETRPTNMSVIWIIRIK